MARISDLIPGMTSFHCVYHDEPSTPTSIRPTPISPTAISPALPAQSAQPTASQPDTVVTTPLPWWVDDSNRTVTVPSSGTVDRTVAPGTPTVPATLATPATTPVPPTIAPPTVPAAAPALPPTHDPAPVPISPAPLRVPTADPIPLAPITAPFATFNPSSTSIPPAHKGRPRKFHGPGWDELNAIEYANKVRRERKKVTRVEKKITDEAANTLRLPVDYFGIADEPSFQDPKLLELYQRLGYLSQNNERRVQEFRTYLVSYQTEAEKVYHEYVQYHAGLTKNLPET